MSATRIPILIYLYLSFVAFICNYLIYTRISTYRMHTVFFGHVSLLLDFIPTIQMYVYEVFK